MSEKQAGNEEGYTEVPVLVGFDQNQCIGSLRIKTSQLPATPNFVFSLGYQTVGPCKFAQGEIPTTDYSGEYKLFCVSLTSDDSYIGFLRQVGRIV